MALPPSTAAQLAHRVLRHLGSEAGAAGSWMAALAAACRQLRADLTDTLGSGGANALLARALFRASRNHSILDVVTLEHRVGDATGPALDRCFSGLELASGKAPEEEEAAATAILTELFGLLATFLGEDLGLQPVLRHWPGVTLDVKEIDE